QSLEDFDGGGFTGAVGAEQSEDFAGTHFEIDAFDGRKAGVALGEGFHLNGIVHELTSFSQAGRGDALGKPDMLVRRYWGRFVENKRVNKRVNETGRTFMSGLSFLATPAREELN